MPSDAKYIQHAESPCETAADAKQKTQHATERGTDAIHAPRHADQEKMSHVDPTDVVFIDETGVNMAMTRQSGRAPKGERVQTSAP